MQYFNNNMSNFKPTVGASLVIDGMSSGIETGVVENYIMSNYSMSIDQLIIKKDKLPLFLEELKNDPDIGVTDEKCFVSSNFEYSNGNCLKIIEYYNEHIGWYINVNTMSDDIFLCSVFCKSIQIAETIFNIFKKYEHNISEISVKINTIAVQGNNINYKSNTTVKTYKDFEDLSKLYYPFLNTDEMFKQFLISKDKLMILSGEPGTGKTKIVDLFLSYCISNINLLGFKDSEIDDGASINVAYIKNADLLSTDALWSHMSQQSYNLVILDDIDNMLTDRSAVITSGEDVARKKFISQFLSFTDGIFNKKTKFIITTNQDIGTVDKAILRKGRCFDILTFRKLKRAESLGIWLEAGLLEEDFDKEYKADIELLACDVSSKINNYKNKISSDFKPYVLEEGISIMSHINTKKIKIGGK